MTRKPANLRPWHCIACGVELPPERAQGRCLECLIGKRPVVLTDGDGREGAFRIVDPLPWLALRPSDQAEAEAALAEHRSESTTPFSGLLDSVGKP